MKKKTDLIYVIVNVLCLVLLIADIELKNYFGQLVKDYESYTFPLVMSNLSGPVIVCLLIVFRQSYHQKVSLPSGIIVNSCSAVVFLIYNYYLLRFGYIPELAPESLVILCLFIVTAVYNIYSKLQTGSTPREST